MGKKHYLDVIERVIYVLELSDRSVIMKLSSKYPYQEVYKKCICLES